ncbi:BA71V-M1249L, partial [Elysia marginata]
KKGEPGASSAAVLPYSPNLVVALRRQLGAASAYHLSGAGAAVALDTAAAKLQTSGRIRAPATALTKAIVQVPSVGIELPTRAFVEFFVKRIAGVFPGVVATPEEFVFALTPLLDIFRVGAFAAYYHILTEGREALGAQRFLERTASAQAEREQLAALSSEIFAETALARHYTIIIEDKFGAGRAHKLSEVLALLGPTAADSPKVVLDQLHEREREIVTLEYENRRHEWEALSNNQCPHVRLAYRLRSAKSSKDAIDTLKALSAYFKRPQALAKPEWILCKNCGFRALCPHVEERIQMEARNCPYDAIRTRLMKYAVQYADRWDKDGSAVRDTYSYFCRICSECLAEFTGEDRTADILGAVGTLDDHIRKVIWTEAAKAANFLQFPVPVDPRKFASTAVDVCHPLLLVAEANLLKRRRRVASTFRSVGSDGSSSGDEETVDPRTHLYIALFVYAHILNLIRASYESTKDNNRRLGFEGVRPGAKMSVFAATILSTVLGNFAALIARIEDITPEFIANRFREAYRLVVGEKPPQELMPADEAKLIVAEITALNPVYHYIATAARIFGALPIERPLTPSAAKHEFETVLGRSLPEILENRGTDSDSELVQMLLGVRPTGRGVRRVVIEYPRGSDPLYVYNEAAVNFLLKMFRAPSATIKKTDMGPFDRAAALAKAAPACGDRCVVEAVGGRASQQAPQKKQKKPSRGKKPPGGALPYPVFNPRAFLRGAETALAPVASGLFLRSYELFTEYATEITSAEKMAAYQARLATARSSERGYLLARAAFAVKNYRQFGFTLSRRFGLHNDERPAVKHKIRLEDMAGPAVPLTYLYDEDGFPHSWANNRVRENIYIYLALHGEAADGSTPPLELTQSAIVDALETGMASGETTGPIHGRILFDVKCGTCGVLLSEISALSEKKTRRSLQALSESAAFFAFYDSRCPVDGFHEFPGSGSPCKKCGLEEALVSNHGEIGNAAKARAFYDKYLERYHEQRTVVTTTGGVIPAAAHSFADPTAEAIRNFGLFAKNWKFDYSLVVQAGKLIDTPVAVFEALGATEGRTYPDVLSGINAPSPPSSADDPRLLAADSDVRVFVSAYNRLRFVHRFPKPGLDTEAILREAKVPKHEYRTLAEALPDIFDSYCLKRVALAHFRPPADVLLFTIETLARMALTVASVDAEGKDWLSCLGLKFAQQTLREVIRSERLLAKNGPFNFQIFGVSDMGSGSGEDFAAGEFGDVGEDVLEQIDADAGEDGALDTFSLEGIDIDSDDPNLEPE